MSTVYRLEDVEYQGEANSLAYNFSNAQRYWSTSLLMNECSKKYFVLSLTRLYEAEGTLKPKNSLTGRRVSETVITAGQHRSGQWLQKSICSSLLVPIHT